jgi:cytochrome c oxidase subunit 3
VTDVTTQVENEHELWAGGRSPYKVSNIKLGMWLFIISDALTFAAMLFGYAYFRHASDDWPTPFEFFPSIVVSTLMTFCLLTSSLTMVLAVHHSQRGDSARAFRWLLATMAGGMAFLVLHANEWRELIHHGMTTLSNPWGDAMFGATFFTITGLHMFHVFTGVIYLGVVALRVEARKNFHDEVEVAGLYWHFVDLVWMFVFPLIYLMSVNMGGGGH